MIESTSASLQERETHVADLRLRLIRGGFGRGALGPDFLFGLKAMERCSVWTLTGSCGYSLSRLCRRLGFAVFASDTWTAGVAA
ncbi:MAG: hypothetical protein Q7T63_21890 [Burkholderiaceae bacterium]|nr:hypothetical protein [Burkholderiaceae bacterium]MDO9090212.1 hypothetical protein [Burkholderiaceae bacterium]